jgi:hypothetical protein
MRERQGEGVADLQLKERSVLFCIKPTKRAFICSEYNQKTRLEAISGPISFTSQGLLCIKQHQNINIINNATR